EETDAALDLNGVYDDITALGSVEIPVSELYNTQTPGIGAFDAGGDLTADNVVLNFYGMETNAVSGLWAAAISGDYVLPTGDAWSITVNGNVFDSVSNTIVGTVVAVLTGVEWVDGFWRAEVSGSSPEDAFTFTGIAAGSFGDGNFSGAGTGLWAGLPSGSIEPTEFDFEGQFGTANPGAFVADAQSSFAGNISGLENLFTDTPTVTLSGEFSNPAGSSLWG
ncbi:MAG: hypothetical protein GY940_36680, partial [bacterium]|nr:hypothetical protein [bacterium]